MVTIVDLDISVAGRPTGLISRVNHLQIASRYDGHHTFDLQVLLSRTDTVDLSEIEAHLGEPIEIRYSWSSGASSVFRGFIDEIIPSWTADGGRVLALKGWSPTLFLDCGPAFRCFSETTLDVVLNKILAPYRRYFPRLNIGPKASQKIRWSVQANETDFQYLCRLADQSGVQEMWYDGDCLHFDDLTSPTSDDDICLVKGEGLHSLSLSLNTAPLSFSVKTYDFVNGAYPEAQAGPMTSTIPLINAALKKSEAYPAQRIFLPYPMEGNRGLQPLIRRFASKQAHELLVLTGQSNDPRLLIGSKITIDTRDDMLETELSGQFVVIRANHQISKNGQYENGFTAVPISHPYNLRMTSGRGPVCGPMAAEVVDCNDPERIGRVKVRFLADELKATSPWLRCLTPYTSKGGVFQMPHKHEHVMVLGEDFNLEHGGFVLNAFFHKNSRANKWDPAKERGIRYEGAGMLFTREKVNTWADTVQTNARRECSSDAPKIYLNCQKGAIPDKNV